MDSVRILVMVLFLGFGMLESSSGGRPRFSLS